MKKGIFHDELGIPEVSDADSGIACAADMFTLALTGQRERRFEAHGLKTRLNRLSPSGITSCISVRA